MIPLNELSAAQAARRIEAGEATSEALAAACLERIAAREKEVRAWAFLDREQALAQARALDRMPRRSRLHGVPVGIKDIIDTADLPTEYGSPIYRGHRPKADAACVALLKNAGCLILGKTVTTELANNHPAATRNPHKATDGAVHTPGGSSSGSAAAVAEFLVGAPPGTPAARQRAPFRPAQAHHGLRVRARPRLGARQFSRRDQRDPAAAPGRRLEGRARRLRRDARVRAPLPPRPRRAHARLRFPPHARRARRSACFAREHRRSGVQPRVDAVRRSLRHRAPRQGRARIAARRAARRTFRRRHGAPRVGTLGAGKTAGETVGITAGESIRASAYATLWLAR